MHTKTSSSASFESHGKTKSWLTGDEKSSENANESVVLDSEDLEGEEYPGIIEDKSFLKNFLKNIEVIELWAWGRIKN